MGSCHGIARWKVRREWCGERGHSTRSAGGSARVDAGSLDSAGIARRKRHTAGGLGTLAVNARKAFSDQQAAKAAAKTATQAFVQAANGKNPDGLRAFGADLVKTIRAFAETTHNPVVYDKANFAPPSPPSPTPPPSQPTDVTATIEPGGALTIRFKATSPGSGAVYLVKRKLASESDFSLIGTADPDSRSNRFKSFLDDSLPPGSNNFEYIFQGKRGSVFGPQSAIFLVRIGTPGGGAIVQELKMAA